MDAPPAGAIVSPLRCYAGLLTLALPALACGGEPVTRGLTEPLAVEAAQFVDGRLPGLPPLTDQEQVDGVAPAEPRITSYDLANQLISPGEPAKSLRGRASPAALAVGVRLADFGSGYWLVPTRNADALNQDELAWDLRAAFNPQLSPGRKQLLLAAIGPDGTSGTQTSVELCIGNLVPDNDNVCDPRRAPPDLVISLAWDAPVDLDLRVVTPEGKIVDAKHPTTALPDEEGAVDASADGVGRLDRDSNRACLIDASQRENLVFERLPSSGTYLVYANLHDACGESNVNFDVSFHVGTLGQQPDTFAVERTFREAGSSQAVHANGGRALGMYVTSFVVP
jgi:hypothetical protein